MIVKNQHYVPICYLKKFANDKEKLKAFDFQNLQILKKEQSLKNICSQKHFHSKKTGVYDEIGQKIEREFSLIENEYNKTYKKLEENIKNKSLPLNKFLKWEFSFYIAFFYLRTLYFRENLNAMTEKYKKDRLKRFDEFYGDKAQKLCLNLKKEDLIKFIHSECYQFKCDNTSHLRFLSEIEKYRDFFAVKNWKIYVIPFEFNYRFITSDVPVLEIFNQFPKNALYWKNIDNNAFWNRTHIFVLSPEILIEIQPNYKSQNMKKKFIEKSTRVCFIKNEMEIHNFNRLRLEHSQKYAYSKTDIEFSFLLKIFSVLKSEEFLKKSLLGLTFPIKSI